jgi:FkbM family methyltransferase
MAAPAHSEGNTLSSRLAELPKTLRDLLRHPINRGHKLAALQRYLKWQVSSRLAPGPVAVELVAGARVLVRPGMPGAQDAVCFGLHEFEEMAFVLHALLPGDLFVDCGASSGTYAVLAAGGAGAHCLAYEPLELAADIGLNGLQERISQRRAGLGAKAGRLRMTTREGECNHVTRDHEPWAEGTLWVPVEALDDALAAETRPFIVKLSVEGFELPVLRGGRHALAKPNALAVIARVDEACEGYGFTPGEFDEEIRTLGFEPVAYQPFRRRLSDLDWRDSRAAHILYVKNRPVVAGRVAAAPLRRVLGTDL